MAESSFIWKQVDGERRIRWNIFNNSMPVQQ